MLRYLLILLAASLCAIACQQPQAYLFTSFHEPADKGLRLLYSYDGYHWEDMDTTFLTPTVGSGVMRDPSMAMGPDGTFHLVWTCGWRGDPGFGYAHSKDLIHWSEQQFIPVMNHEPTTVNVWAPELYYDAAENRFIIIWASTIPNRFPKGQEAENNNHRMYYTTTQDFTSFTETKLYLDPGFSVIDAVIVPRAQNDYVLVLKDNTRPNRNLRVAFGNTPLGPYQNVSAPFTANFTEGPTALKVHHEWVIYYDAYQQKKFGAVKTRDFQHFEDVSQQIHIPPAHKHGTALPVPESVLKKLLSAVQPGTPVN